MRSSHALIAYADKNLLLQVDLTTEFVTRSVVVSGTTHLERLID